MPDVLDIYKIRMIWSFSLPGLKLTEVICLFTAMWKDSISKDVGSPLCTGWMIAFRCYLLDLGKSAMISQLAMER